jgi:hypothetical protein
MLIISACHLTKCGRKRYLKMNVSICDIHVKRKILVINETKRDEIFVKTKSYGPRKTSFNTLKSAMKFAELSSIFNGMNERYQNSANIRQYWTVVPSDFNIINLIYFGLLQNLKRYCERLQKFMIFHKTNKIFLVKSFTFVHFRSFAMYFVDLLFKI